MTFGQTNHGDWVGTGKDEGEDVCKMDVSGNVDGH